MKKESKDYILKVLVGSRANGLAYKHSDYDYRAIYALPSSEILSIGYNYKGTTWMEGKVDNTAYEIGHFLFLATKCNPTILEVFKAPVTLTNEYGLELRGLFDNIWEPQLAFNAFTGYGLNQRKKMLDNREGRRAKYAIAYIRTLCNLIDLLDTGDFSLEINEGWSAPFEEDLKGYRANRFTNGEIVDMTERLTEIARDRLKKCKQKPNLKKANKFLLKIRRKKWLK